MFVAFVSVGAVVGTLAVLLCIWAVLRVTFGPLQPPPTFHLGDKHIVITGGSSGIGKEVARICVARGAFVTLLARTQSRLEEAQSELEHAYQSSSRSFTPSRPGRVHIESADVTDEDAVIRAIRSAEAKFGPVDALVCSAGATNPLYFEQLTVEDFQKQLDVNFLGIVRCVRAVLPGMKERRRGRIVLISSMVGQLGMFGYTAYSSAKFAVRGFAECLYPETKPYNVHVSVSYPPDTDTPMYEEEMRLKPLETKLMSESSSVFPPVYVAKDICDALQYHKFTICHGFDGHVLRILGGGLQPPNSLSAALIDVVSFPLLRFVWVFVYLRGWFSIALKHAGNRSTSVSYPCGRE